MFGRENLEDFEKSIEGEHYYVCAEANKVMDAYEARIRELENEKAGLLNIADALNLDNKALTNRVKELEESQPKWISVKEREPEDLNVVVCIDQKGRPKLMQSLGIENWQEYDNWFNDPTHWMPLPPCHTTSRNVTTTEKSTEDIKDSLITEQTNNSEG